MKLFLCSLMFFMLVICGCQSTKTLPPHLLRAGFDTGTYNQSLNIDHTVDFSNYRTFSIIDPPDSSGSNQLAGLAGSSMKFGLSAFLESRGYRPAGPDEFPDMFVAISGRVDTQNQRIAAHSGVLPIWKPGKTYTYNSYSSGNFNAYSNYGNTYYGNISGSTTGSVRSQGGLKYVPYSVPERTIQKNFAQLMFAFFDAKSNKELAIAKASANTYSNDPTYACYPLVGVMNNFPPNVSQFQEFAKNFKWKGYAGFMAYPFPVNGMNYPKVASVDPKGGASRAGLKVDDVIVSINEIQTNNVPFIKFLRELEVFPGDVLSIVVWRGEDKYKTLKIKTTQRPQ